MVKALHRHIIQLRIVNMQPHESILLLLKEDGGTNLGFIYMLIYCIFAVGTFSFETFLFSIDCILMIIGH